jgi:ketosteroid isomerase-like protein
MAGCVSANVEQERTALLARDQAWSDNAKTADGLLAFMAPDATAFPPGAPKATGTEAIRTTVTEMFSTPGFSIKWTPAKAEVSGAGDVGYTTGSYTTTMTNPAGNPTTETGKYVTVWKKQANEWKVVEDIFNADAVAAPSAAHAMVGGAGAVTWGDPPPSLPPGAKLAVLMGDPTKAGPFTIRGQLPAGYKIPAHWHPTDEYVTVLSGTFGIGMGEKFDEAALKDLNTGGFVALPATGRHFAMAKTATTIQVNGMGPFILNYVNPADDPSKK